MLAKLGAVGASRALAPTASVLAAKGGKEALKQAAKTALIRGGVGASAGLGFDSLKDDDSAPGWEGKLGSVGDLAGSFAGSAIGGLAGGGIGSLATGLGGSYLGSKIGNMIGKLLGKAIDGYSSPKESDRKKAVSLVKNLILKKNVDPLQMLMAQDSKSDLTAMLDIFAKLNNQVPSEKGKQISAIMKAKDDLI